MCNNDGLRFTGMDRSHICFFEGIISKELFDEYELDDGLFLYINLDELIKVLKRGKNKDNLIFEADNEVFNIKFKDKSTRTFKITQIDALNDSKTPPSLDYATTFKCDFDTIKNSLVDSSLYSFKIELVRENDVLYLNSEGQSGEYSNECILDESIDGSYSARYSSQWLLKIFKTKLDSSNLVISMGQDFPMEIKMDSEFVSMRYLLAPYLDNGED